MLPRATVANLLDCPGADSKRSRQCFSGFPILETMPNLKDFLFAQFGARACANDVVSMKGLTLHGSQFEIPRAVIRLYSIKMVHFKALRNWALEVIPNHARGSRANRLTAMWSAADEKISPSPEPFDAVPLAWDDMKNPARSGSPPRDAPDATFVVNLQASVSHQVIETFLVWPIQTHGVLLERP
jgi:hypothetical protein